MKKLLVALILILLAGAGGYAYLKYGKTEDKASVTQATITQGNIVQAVQATGTLEALRTVQVGSQVSGTVADLMGVDFNSIVKKDQVIAKLDASLLQVQVEVQHAAIERQQSDIDNQKVQLENDQLTLKRTQAQFDKGLVSPQQLEAAQLQIKNRQATITSSEKQLVQATANLHQAELNVSYCTIKSPIDGVIVDRKVDIGQTVQASMTTPQFFTIATDLTTLKLTAGVDEADIGFLRPGMQASFTVDAYGTQPFSGTVDAVRLNATTSNNVVTYPVWINVQNPDLKLRPSMTATVRIIVDQANGVLRIPNQALRFRPTTDIYTWLGMTPPAAGRGRGGNANADGRGGRAGGQGANAADATAGATAPAAGAAPGKAAEPAPGQPANADAGGNPNRRQRGQGQDQAGQGGQGQGGPGQGGGQNRQFGQGGQNAGGDAQGGRGGRGGAGGFGRGMGNNLTPEQMAQFQQQFGGRGGGGRGGRGNRQQQPANAVVGNVTPMTQRNADKIDELFESVPKKIQPGQVWLYDEKNPDVNKRLRMVSVRYGLTDSAFSELVSSGENFAVGMQVVTGVIPPPSALPKPGQNNIFQQNRGGFGGPGGPQPGGPGGPGGGAPRGGGGGGGRGGD